MTDSPFIPDAELLAASRYRNIQLVEENEQMKKLLTEWLELWINTDYPEARRLFPSLEERTKDLLKKT